MFKIQSNKIGIIGAGVSGITAAKQLAHYNPVVFEATNLIGGVWRHCSFHNTKLQTRACEYEFSDFPLPNSSDPNYFPPTVKILEYLDDYVVRFDLLKFVKFNSKVVETRYVGDPERLGLKPGEYGDLLNGTPAWEVAVQSYQTNDVQWYSFELLVVCTGKYGEIPRMPNFEPGKGPEVFNGQVMHSVDYAKLDKERAREVIQSKRVVIIGFKKSALDLAKDFADINQGIRVGQITMVVRSLHWPVPHYWIWGIPFHTLYMSRFTQFLWERPDQGTFKTLASFLLLPLRKAISKFVESYLLWKLPLKKYGLKPDHPFEEDYASCQMPILPNNFFDEVEKGNIQLKKAKRWWFCSDGIEFNDGTRSGADVVILATGYDGRQKLRQILPEPYLSYMLKPNFLPLYRGTIHPMIPNMAFVGYIETLANLGTGELRCKWLASLADGKFKLPSIEKMLEQSRKEQKVLKRSTRFYQKQGISVGLINHADEICKDMGVKAWRKKNLLLEAFSPYVSKDYAD